MTGKATEGGENRCALCRFGLSMENPERSRRSVLLVKIGQQAYTQISPLAIIQDASHPPGWDELRPESIVLRSGAIAGVLVCREVFYVANAP